MYRKPIYAVGNLFAKSLRKSTVYSAAYIVQ